MEIQRSEVSYPCLGVLINGEVINASLFDSKLLPFFFFNQPPQRTNLIFLLFVTDRFNFQMSPPPGAVQTLSCLGVPEPPNITLHHHHLKILSGNVDSQCPTPPGVLFLKPGRGLNICITFGLTDK